MGVNKFFAQSPSGAFSIFFTRAPCINPFLHYVFTHGEFQHAASPSSNLQAGPHQPEEGLFRQYLLTASEPIVPNHASLS
jgi:hypothetical protein